MLQNKRLFDISNNLFFYFYAMKNILKYKYAVLRILIGIVFIVSAILKLSPIAPFENLLLKLDVVPWDFVPFVARAIIGFEFMLGIILIVNLYIKFVLRLTLFTLIGFTLFLLYLHVFVSSEENCGCFGEIVELNPVESIIKNLLLLVFVVYLLRNKSLSPLKFLVKYHSLIAIGFITISFSLPFIFNVPITAGEEGNYVVKPGMKISHPSIRSVVFNTKDTADLAQGKHVICFSSLSCNTCKYAISKLESIHKKNPEFAISIIFLDVPHRDSLLLVVKEKTGLQTIPYSFIQSRDFFETSHNKLPFIMFVDNGQIKNLRNYSDLYIGDVFTFFEK